MRISQRVGLFLLRESSPEGQRHNPRLHIGKPSEMNMLSGDWMPSFSENSEAGRPICGIHKFSTAIFLSIGLLLPIRLTPPTTEFPILSGGTRFFEVSGIARTILLAISSGRRRA